MSIEITVLTTTEFSELIADALAELGSEGVAIYDEMDYKMLKESQKNWDYADESAIIGDKVRVIGQFEGEMDAVLASVADALALIKERTPFDNPNFEVVGRTLADVDWQKQYFDTMRPIEVGGITILPHKELERGSGLNLFIEASMAFGTGSHESTMGCLELLQELDLKDKIVIDVGCGTGILGLAALLLGAKSAYLIDNDEQCIKAARQNAIENGLMSKCFIIKNDLLNGCKVRADVLTANLTADLLIKMKTALSLNLAMDGRAVISGILDSRLKEVEQALASVGLEIEKELSLGEWRAAIVRRKAGSGCAVCPYRVNV